MSTSKPRLVPHLVLSTLGAAVLAAGCSNAAASPPTPGQIALANSATTLDTPTLVERVKDAVVNITVEQAVQRRGRDQGLPSEFFFRNGPAPENARRAQALGTGFIFDAKGHVLTNAHVVEGAEVVKVRLADERVLRAKVKGRDERLDVAVLEIEGADKPLPFVTLGASSSTRVGESVVAIGNPFGLGNTVTTGIVSAKGRAIGAGPYDDFLQTDASINPGNSGGPLFDTHGQVIGMNTAINPAGQGIGFAIPSDAIREVVPQLVSVGHVDRGRLGVTIKDVDDGPHGALIAGVEKGGPAAQAGLAGGDVIVRVDAAPITHARDLSREIGKKTPGTKVDLTIQRGTQTRTATVTVAKLEDPAG